MTSKKFPPIPPYYPAVSEGGNIPQPGPGYPPLPYGQTYAKPYPEFPAPVPASGIPYLAAPAPRLNFAPSSDDAQKDGMNPIQKFTHALSTGYMVELSAIIGADGSHWFLASETARALGYLNPRKAIIDHCKHAQLVGGVTNRDPIPGVASLDPQTKIIPEGDVNRLISRSRLPAAVEIQDWWFDEVIPTIRRTGGYGLQKPLTPRQLAQMVIDAEDRAEAAEALLVAEARKSISLANQNVGLAQELHTSQDLTSRFREGINMLTALLGTPDGICLQDAANQLGQPQHAFNEWLGEKGKWIYRSRSKSKRWKPHAYAIAKGWLGDKQYIRHKNSMERFLYTPSMGPVDPNEFYIFREVEIMPAGMVRLLQYTDHISPDSPALRIKRGEYGVKLK